MRMLFRYLKPYKNRMLFSLLVKSIGTVMDLTLPWILAYMIDDIVPLKNKPMILFWGVVMLLCAAVALLGNVIANRLAARVARDTTERLRGDLFSKIMYLSVRQTDALTIPTLVSRLSSDTYHLHSMVGMMQRIGVRAPILLVGGVCLTFVIEPVLSLVLLCTLPLIAFVVFYVSKKGIPIYADLQRSVDGMVRTVRENFTGIRVIKALSKTEYEKKRFKQINQEVVTNETKAGILMGITNPSMNLLLNLGMTAVIVIGAFRVNAGMSNPGKIIAFMTYFTIILNALMAVTRMFVMYSRGVASANRISQVLQIDEGLRTIESPGKDTGAHILFHDISFSYDGGKKAVENISFSVNKGETLGIIGETGCGKTTILQLLLRFYDPDNGDIYIGGENIKSMDLSELRGKFGVVFQNDFLYSDSIYENIDFARSLPKKAVEDAARFAQAEEFISGLENGFDYRIAADGSNLSGGQKQRLFLSRALAGDPEILILDDSTSALDYKTDAALRGSIGTHFKKTTSIIVAQRISSIRSADRILVMSGGKIIGMGTDGELLEQCQIYREISDSQMGEVRL